MGDRVPHAPRQRDLRRGTGGDEALVYFAGAVAHKISSGVVGDDVFAAAAAYVAKALARDALGDFVTEHRDDSLLLASL